MARKSATVGVLGVIIYIVLCQVSSYIQYHDQQHSSSTPHVREEAKTKEINNSTVNKAIEDAGSDIVGTDIMGNGDYEEIDISIEDDHEPFIGRWKRRFASSEGRGKKGGYVFLKHIRKAGGTSVRSYLIDVLGYHNMPRQVADFRAEKHGPRGDKYQAYYIEQEFQGMDSQCPSVDPRWKESLSIIVLRHPIERHLSEFFFSGEGLKYPIDTGQIYTNKTYTDGFASFLEKYVPKWMKHEGRMNGEGGDMEGKFNMIFGPFYTPNFQLRSLAGCSSAECLKGKEVTEEQMDKINDFHPSSYSYSEPIPRCTQYIRKEGSLTLLEVCAKPKHIKKECETLGCDGPCFYPTAAWGELGKKDVTRAVNALKAFDAVLLMDELNSQDQSDFLSDILGVPRDAHFSLAKMNARNAVVEKNGKREKARFYRDILSKLGLKKLQKQLYSENELEIEFFHHAVKLNKIMIDQWKRE